MYPTYICSAADGSMYVSSSPESMIYKVSPQGSFSPFIRINSPQGLKAGENGTVYFVANGPNSTTQPTSALFKVDKNKKVTMLPMTGAFSDIIDLAIGPDSTLYFADYLNHQIIKLSTEGITSVLAGKKGVKGYSDGQGENAHFTNPTFVKFGNDGNLWVVDGQGYWINQSIRKVTMDGKVTTFFQLIPDGKGRKDIESFAVSKRDKNFNTSPYENVFFFVRTYTSNNQTILHQLFHLSYDKVLTPITGNLPENYFYTDGPASQANFNSPSGITVNPNGIFVADQQNWVIRKIATR